MSDEITTEVLAKATNKTIDTARSGREELKLRIGGQQTDFVVLDRVGSDRKIQLNAIAIAPKLADGTPDYDNVAVVFAGTNNVTGRDGTGRSGALSAARTLEGGLSEEYTDASRFLERTLKSVEAEGGRVTDVSGFSQSGGYMMKIAANYGQEHGFQSTSFDDFGGKQYKTLTESEREWLKKNPQKFLRYQNDSWAKYSKRESEWGTVVSVTSTAHDTLPKYFDGDVLNLGRLAKDGNFAPGMTEAQVRLAAEAWVKKNRDKKRSTSLEEEIEARIRWFENEYGSYGSGKSRTKSSGTVAGKVGLRTGFSGEGAALITAAITHLEKARQVNDAIPDQLEESYRRVIQETSAAFSFILDPYDVEAEAHRLGLQPSLHMDRAAIAQVNAKITADIEVLEHLKATLQSVAVNRSQLDAEQASRFHI